MKEVKAIEHVNRMGKVYYLQEGKTPTGKPKYYTGGKVSGKPLTEIPEGYEIYEKPDTAQVVVRKIKASVITEFERRQTEDIVRRTSGLTHFIVEIDGDALVVYTPSISPAEADSLSDLLAGPGAAGLLSTRNRFREERLKHCQYIKMLRFELDNPDTRQYSAQRWCFLGSIDDWFPLFGSGTLATLVEKCAVHLGQESFFELM